MDLWSDPVLASLIFLHAMQTLRMWTQLDSFQVGLGFFFLKRERSNGFAIFQRVYIKSHLLFRENTLILMSKAKRNLRVRWLVLLEWFACRTINLAHSMCKTGIWGFASCDPTTCQEEKEQNLKGQELKTLTRAFVPALYGKAFLAPGTLILS